MTSPKVSDCRRCRHGKEIFWYMGLYEYDVDRACALAGDGREAVELDDESARQSVAESELDEAHLWHVDPDIPGVIAHVRYEADGGEVLHGHVLIDGHHRAARCLREGRPFLVYLLTEEESQAVLLRRPEDPFPRAKVQPRTEGEHYYVNHPRTGAQKSLTEEEYFLFLHFDGRHTAAEIRAAYQDRFGEPLSRERLNGFVLWAQDRGYLEDALSRTTGEASVQADCR